MAFLNKFPFPQDLFHIGHVQKDIGNSFACSSDKGWDERYVRSPTGLSTINATVTQKLLVNRQGTRDVSLAHNKITFEVAITLMNTDAVAMMDGFTREIAFGIRIGDSKIWTALHEITIDKTPIAGPGGAAGAPTVDGNVTLLNDITNTGGVYAGNAAVFRVTMTAPMGAWTNFDAELTGDHSKGCTAVGVRIVDSGLTGYALDDRSVDSFDNATNKVTTNFGDLHNPHASKDTLVTLELTFATDKDDPGTANVQLPDAKIGGVAVTLPTNWSILQNVRLKKSNASPTFTSQIMTFPGCASCNGSSSRILRIQR